MGTASGQCLYSFKRADAGATRIRHAVLVVYLHRAAGDMLRARAGK